MASKITTNLTGLAVQTNPHHMLSVLYGKILDITNKIPDSAKYKQHTKALVQDRLNMVQTIKDVPTLEAKINSGQIEEVIKEAEYELKLAKTLLQTKPWEPLIGEAPVDQWKWPI
jgi:NADH dehydrogenase (ubiquinone) 1 alpha subcomplex subunit 5